MICRYSLHIWCPDMWYLGTGNFARQRFFHKHISKIKFIVATNCYSDFAVIYHILYLYFWTSIRQVKSWTYLQEIWPFTNVSEQIYMPFNFI